MSLIVKFRMVAIACIAMTVVHPGIFCKPDFFNDKLDRSKDSNSQSEEDNSASIVERPIESEK